MCLSQPTKLVTSTVGPLRDAVSIASHPPLAALNLKEWPSRQLIVQAMNYAAQTVGLGFQLADTNRQ